MTYSFLLLMTETNQQCVVHLITQRLSPNMEKVRTLNIYRDEARDPTNQQCVIPPRLSPYMGKGCPSHTAIMTQLWSVQMDYIEERPKIKQKYSSSLNL